MNYHMLSQIAALARNSCREVLAAYRIQPYETSPDALKMFSICKTIIMVLRDPKLQVPKFKTLSFVLQTCRVPLTLVARSEITKFEIQTGLALTLALEREEHSRPIKHSSDAMCESRSLPLAIDRSTFMLSCSKSMHYLQRDIGRKL